jgi:hypothetical protein
MSQERSRVPEPLTSGPVLIGVFTVLALVTSAGTALLLGGNVDHVLWALVTGLLAGGAIVGTYTLGRRAGQPHSHAVAGTAVVFGVLLLAAIVAELLHSAGELSNVGIGVGVGGAVLAAVAILGLTALLERASTA